MASVPAFEDLYRDYVRRIYGFCLSKVSHVALADDLTADTFQRAWAAYSSLDRVSSEVEPWLFRIARNAIIDHHRRQYRWLGVIPRIIADVRLESTIEVDAAQREDIRQAFAALGRLRERDRTIISLRVGGDLSYAAIAKVLDMNEATATAAGHRAFARLRKIARDME